MRNNSLNPSLTLQHILNEHLDSLINQGLFNTYQCRIFSALKQCKTPALGEHWEACDSCGVVKVHYNSCGNRHCPQCQGVDRERWLLDRENDLFDLLDVMPEPPLVWDEENRNWQHTDLLQREELDRKGEEDV